jgi:hypothetical protein
MSADFFMLLGSLQYSMRTYTGKGILHDTCYVLLFNVTRNTYATAYSQHIRKSHVFNTG